VSTTTSIALWAIRMPNGRAGQLVIQPSRDFECSLRGAVVDQIAGDLHGRVYLGTGTSGVTELLYGEVPPRAAASESSIENFLQGMRGAAQAAIELAAEACGRPRKQCRTVQHTFILQWNLYGTVVQLVRQWDPDPLVDMVLDHHRSQLYTLGASGTISVYLLGGPSDYPQLGCRLTHPQLRKQATDAARDDGARGARGVALGLLGQSSGGAGGGAGLGYPLVRLSPVSPSDSKRVHLMAMDEGGARLYFSLFNPDRGEAKRAYDDSRVSSYSEQAGIKTGKHI